jgi:MFS transporter, FHS family, glucose/mannose:H+ symporter
VVDGGIPDPIHIRAVAALEVPNASPATIENPRDVSPGVRLSAGLLACISVLSVGWTVLLIPSLIRSIKLTYDQTDAGIGIVYFLLALAYAVGSFGGGPLTERLGRRAILGGAVLLTGIGALGLGIAPTWTTFMLAAMVAGAGAGCVDGGANGLVLDVYREGRGRAMSLLHVSYSVGALVAPLAIGALVVREVPWQAVVAGTGGVIAMLALAYVVVPMPSGRRSTPATVTHGALAASEDRALSLRTGPLLLLGIAIAAYTASEMGVSNWIVRFLEPAPLTTATLALSLYWVGLTVGRIVSSVIADWIDHLRFALVSALGIAAAIAVAVLAPSLPIAMTAFLVAGVASGPVFPMIVAVGGDRFPERSAAVGGSLTGMAIIGSTIYPPAMGFMSVTVGLTAAMLGNAVLAGVCVLALVAFGRSTRTET